MSITLEAPATIFDAESPPRRLGPASNGLPMSREEFFAVEEADELYRYELVHGVVIVSPAPSEGECGPNDELAFWLRDYRRRRRGKKVLNDTLPEQEIDTNVCIRRADRVIWTGLGRQPDPQRDVPTIVIEFVSKSSRDRKRDYEAKRSEYAAIGVKEYWIIDRFRRTLTVCRGDQGTQVYKETATYTTDLLPGFELPLGELLAAADRWSQNREA